MNWLSIISFMKGIPLKVYGIAALVLALGGAGLYVRDMHTTLQNYEFEKDSVEAITSKTIAKMVYGRNLQTRRVVQASIKLDSIDKALKQSTKARIFATANIKPIDTTVVLAEKDSIVASDTLSVVAFHDYRAPVTIDENLIVNSKARTVGVNYRLAFDSIHFNVRLACANKSKNGVRPAYVEFETPPYLNFVVDSARQSREVCTPNVLSLDSGSRTNWLKFGGVGVVIGAVASYILFKRK